MRSGSFEETRRAALQRVASDNCALVSSKSDCARRKPLIPFIPRPFRLADATVGGFRIIEIYRDANLPLRQRRRPAREGIWYRDFARMMQPSTQPSDMHLATREEEQTERVRYIPSEKDSEHLRAASYSLLLALDL